MTHPDAFKLQRSILDRRCLLLIMPAIAALLPGLLLIAGAFKLAQQLPDGVREPAFVALLLLVWAWMHLCSQLAGGTGGPRRPGPGPGVAGTERAG